MKPCALAFFIVAYASLVFGQKKPTIYIAIPTQQKPFNHIEWNESAKKFQFAIVTDRTGGHRPGVFPMAIKKLNLLQPEFVMSVGDLIEGYTKDTVRLNAEWNEFKSFIEPLDAPFFYLAGNHDITNEVMEAKWEELFGVSYYHFVYKDVLFLCLNSEDNLRGAGRGTIDDAQYEYIEKVLAENQDVKWTLVFVHQPLWVQEDTKRWKDVEQLLQNRKHNVFAGHYHRYWKSERNNGKYIALATTGGFSPLRGKAYGEFDHVVWVTMTEEGPILANLFLDGIWDENVSTEALVDLVRNRPFPVQITPVYLDDVSMPEKAEIEVRAVNNTDTKMNVRLTGQAHDDLFYQLENTNFTVEPNDVSIFDLKLTNLGQKQLTAYPPLKINADITYRYNNKPDVAFSSNLNFKFLTKHTVKKLPKLNVDGKLTDWKNARWIPVDEVEGSPFDFNGPEDASLQFATAYDETYFYVGIKLVDDDFVVKEGESHWQQDGIHISLDARPKHLSAFNAGEGRGTDWLFYLRTFGKQDPVYGEEFLPIAIESAVEMGKKEVGIEVAFPMDYITKISGGNWASIRLGLGYYDHDRGDESPTPHFWFPAWDTLDNIPGSGLFFRE